MSENPELLRKLYPEMLPEPPELTWIRLIILLAIFLLVPYLYVRFVEQRLKSFMEKINQRVSLIFSRKFH